MQRSFLTTVICALGWLSQPTLAATFDLPTDGSSVVGQVRVVVPSKGNTLLDVMRHFDIGYEEITTANPGVSVWTPGEFTQVVIPTQFILPPKPWQGIVINIPQRRLYYFPPAKKGQAAKVLTYPISIAREGWSTPLGETRIVAKYKDPSWFVPKSIKEEHLRDEGVELPEYFPPGPDNPMGMLAMKTGFAGIFIHATNRPWGIGLRTSHGCLHLYPEDAAEIFPLLGQNTPVKVIDEPVLVGNDRGRWVMATYQPVAEYPNSLSLFSRALLRLGQQLAQTPVQALPRNDFDWGRVQAIASKPQSIPVALTQDQLGVAAWVDTLPVERYDYAPYGMDANNAQLPEPRPRQQ
ncbi:L,D-transpeptidase ErfK/SrfK [Chitinivorax tropicus]|uniref:L,D-transpeptidase ErfK/SrfK n=1 Tax=Chitinivorax tropicus TaxID=714531 RepID=A0A840MFP1_9PROT|nr:L,D-transpeptidase family protein [Chitinivorax tropicus]MBB5017220.1 L,D-transpeptidase ErfK/SrfK [Chitinivorax tropicus]